MFKKITVMFLILIQFGCASQSDFISQAERQPLPPSLNITADSAALSISLDSVVIPDGPGSWVRQAAWDEYLLTFRNLSNQTITIEQVQLVDSRGIYISQGTNPDQLVAQSEAMMREYQDMGVAVAIYAAPAVVGGVALTTGAFGAAAGALALAPVALVAGPAYYFGKKYADQRDEESVQAEFNRRNISALTFSPQATYKGSVFFPIIPSPTSLVVSYRQGTEFSSLTVNLEQLQGLHISTGP